MRWCLRCKAVCLAAVAEAVAAVAVVVVAVAVAAGCSDFRAGPIGVRDVVVDTHGGSCGRVNGASCDPYSQTGCVSGFACQLVATVTGAYTAGCRVPGPGSFGARCGSTIECSTGHVCVAGQCRQVCCPDDSAACMGASTPATARCDLDLGLGAMGLRACSAHCNWVVQDCTDGRTCAPLDSTGTVSDCIAPGAGTNGAVCGASTDCAAGFLCVPQSGASVCQRVCNPMSATTPCAFTQVCVRVQGAPANFGTCQR